MCGIGFGCFQSPNNREMLSNVAREYASYASGVLSIVRTFGQCLGAAVVGVLLAATAGSDHQMLDDGAVHLALWIAVIASTASVLFSVSDCVARDRLRHNCGAASRDAAPIFTLAPAAQNSPASAHRCSGCRQHARRSPSGVSPPHHAAPAAPDDPPAAHWQYASCTARLRFNPSRCAILGRYGRSLLPGSSALKQPRYSAETRRTKAGKFSATLLISRASVSAPDTYSSPPGS